MKHVLTALLFVVLFLPVRAQVTPSDNLEVTGIPPIPASVVERTNQYLNVRGAGFTGWLPDGSGMYISTRFGNTNQIHLVKGPGMARRQLTFFEEPVYGASPDPRDGKNGFCFMRDVGGGEFYQMFYFDRNQGTSWMLTDGKSRNSGPNWSNKSGIFCFSSNRRNDRDTDVWIMDPDQADGAWILTELDGSWYGAAWSPDDKQLVVLQYVSANETRPYIADLESRTIESMFPESGRQISYGNF
ncbi:MAG: S9 family peptidase, partial [Bacteroidetes bacterium]|nr:S9 family peptidase [Bacteroidota bacterium]